MIINNCTKYNANRIEKNCGKAQKLEEICSKIGDLWSKPIAAGTDTMDTDMDLSTDTELVICICICGTCICVSGGFGVPVSNTM